MNSLISRSAPSPHKLVTKHRYGKDPIFYPLRALSYALSHRELFWTILKVACVGISLSMIVLVVLLATALKAQAQVISANLEWWAWLIAVFLVLFEAGVVSILLMSVSHSKAQTSVFTATMKMEGVWREGMIEQSIAKDLNPMKKAFVVRVLTFPLQIIPFIGGALYSAINATFIGWDHMDRFFDAIQLSPKLQRVEIFGEELSDCRALCNPATYDIDNDIARFGFFCGIIESAPVLGWVLGPITNAIGAALYATDIERSGGLMCLHEEPKDEETNRGPLDALRETGERVIQYGASISNDDNNSRASNFLKKKARESIISSLSNKT
mmetsp:Transcript_14739/g.24120  ORF Transcript_14739/g.24120 Transcript_14739/m.24120 type:complete len:326 (+) Transcript_14739:580-1557(+)